MEYYQLDNGVKIIYKNIQSKLTSISIGLDAGAAVEKNIMGVAHATEHMVFKGTKTRNEQEINKIFHKNFAFHNAMTNYSYVIYYGSLLEEDFEIGIDILSDILINPVFPKEGFKEEMDVIIQELKEWDEDIEQYCEDRLFFNAFNENRLKYPIIGSVQGLKNMTLEDLREFYKENYVPSNTSIAVVSSLDFNSVKETINRFFGRWKFRKRNKIISSSERPKKGIFIEEKGGIKVSRVEIIFPIKELSEIQLKMLKLFDAYFCVGADSVLFDKLRTKNGLVYDVCSEIDYDKDVKLYKIMFTTSKKNVKKAIKLVKESIKEVKKDAASLDEERIKELCKNIKLRKLFKEEQSIQIAKEISKYSVMFNDYKVYENMLENMNNILVKEMLAIGDEVLKQATIQVMNPRE